MATAPFCASRAAEEMFSLLWRMANPASFRQIADRYKPESNLGFFIAIGGHF